MEYQPKGKEEAPRPAKVSAFKEFATKHGVVIGVFQGNRGANPDLDIIVKYQEPDQRVRTPPALALGD